MFKEIFISCFRWLAFTIMTIMVLFGLENVMPCRLDLSPKRWTWQNSQEKYIENWRGSENAAWAEEVDVSAMP